MEIIRAIDAEADIDAIYNILRACGQDMYKNQGLSHWLNPYPKESIRQDILNKMVFVAKDKEKYIATFTLSNCEKALYLSKFAVSPEFSGKGVGKSCLAFAESFSIKNDIYAICA